MSYRVWDIEAKKMRDIITKLDFDISGRVVKCCYCDDDLAEVPLANYGHRKNGKDTFILMQSTGLKDKNGVEIFEGDICKCHIFTQELGENMGVCEGEKEFVCKIAFSPSYGVFLEGNGENSGPIWAYGGMHEESFEVIGNATDNPELLEGTE